MSYNKNEIENMVSFLEFEGLYVFTSKASVIEALEQSGYIVIPPESGGEWKDEKIHQM